MHCAKNPGAVNFFKKFDADGDGSWTREEWNAAVSRMIYLRCWRHGVVARLHPLTATQIPAGLVRSQRGVEWQGARADGGWPAYHAKFP